MKKGFKFGFEIECGIPQDYISDIEGKLTQLGVVVAGDGSIRALPDRYSAREFKTPPLAYNAMYRHLGQVCQILNQYESQVNSSCGLHMHTSNIRFTSQKYLKRIIHTWVAIEDVLISTQPPSRYNRNPYNQRLLRQYVYDVELQKLPRKKDMLIDKCRHSTRNQNLNLTALVAHKTIENRMHAGTTDVKKMRGWLELNRQFYIYCLTKYNPDEVNQLFKKVICEDKIKEVFELLELSDDTKAFYQTRIKKHLFSSLAREQESAYKTLELIPAKEKALKKLNRIQAEYDRIEDMVDDASGALNY